MEKIDDSICSEIGQDDERAWAAFYAAFAPVLRAYAVRRGCDEPDDAVQDVFVKFVSVARAGCVWLALLRPHAGDLRGVYGRRAQRGRGRAGVRRLAWLRAHHPPSRPRQVEGGGNSVWVM